MTTSIHSAYGTIRTASDPIRGLDFGPYGPVIVSDLRINNPTSGPITFSLRYHNGGQGPVFTFFHNRVLNPDETVLAQFGRYCHVEQNDYFYGEASSTGLQWFATVSPHDADAIDNP